MNRSEAVTEVAKRTGLTEGQVSSVLNNFTDVLVETISRGEVVTLRRFGRFEQRLRRAMTKPHPKTGEPVEVPEKLSVAFLPSEFFKDELNR